MFITTAGGCGPSDRYYEQLLLQEERAQTEEEMAQEVFEEIARGIRQ